MVRSEEMDGSNVDNLKDAIEVQARENEELKALITNLKKENVVYARMDNNLQERLKTVVNLLDEYARVQQELFIDARSAFQSGTLPPVRCTTMTCSDGVFSERADSCEFGAVDKSSMCVIPIKLSSEPDEWLVARAKDVIEQELNSDTVSPPERLSTIPEESSVISSSRKSLSVNVTRLPEDVTTAYLEKYKAAVKKDSPSWNVFVRNPASYFAPFKLKGTITCSRNETETNPKNEVDFEEPASPKTRPKRSTRPETLKEKSLKKKMRRT